VWEITGDFPTSISLNSTIDYPRFNDREVSSAIWLGNAKNNSSVMYADMLRWLILIGFGGDQASSLPSDLERMNKNSYIFSGTYNINYGVMRMDGFIAKISSIIDGKNSIYNNGGAIIYSS
jgi:uncharacterized membrane protein